MSDDARMNCSEVVERLPWLLNHTLPEGERAGTLEHLRGCPDCRAELNDTQELLRSVDVHPAPERLISYVFSEAMELSERATIRNHLAECGQCRVEVDLARESKAAMPRHSSGFLRRTWIGLAAAGVLLTAGLATLRTVWRDGRDRVAVLEQRTRNLEQELLRLRQPVAGARLVDLLPRRGLRERSSDASAAAVVVDLSAAGESTLVLNSQMPAAERSCAIRLDGAENGQTLWTVQAAARGSNGEFVLRIPSGFLQAGVYAAVVTCGALEERYEFRVQP
jgi:hypothetical protein